MVLDGLPAGGAVPGSVDRRVTAMAAVLGVLMLLASLPMAADQQAWADPAWWAASIGYGLAIVLLAPAGAWLPLLAVRALWWLYPLVGLALTVTWVLTRAPGAPPAAWTWGVEPLAVGLAAFAWRPPVAVGYAVIGALSVPVVVWLAEGAVPPGLAEQSLLHLGNVLFVMIFCAMRRHLTQVAQAARGTVEGGRELAVMEAWARRREQVAAVVHDEVLSTLTVAARTAGPPPPALRAAAARGVELLDRGVQPFGAADLVPAAALMAGLRRLCDEHGVVLTGPAPLTPGVAGAHRPSWPEVPAAVLSALLAASGEAVRNSVRHAGRDDVHRRLDVRPIADGVEVSVRDDGRGFDPDAVPPGRMGVRDSILGRIRAVPGGAGTVESSPAGGTVVTLRWLRP